VRFRAKDSPANEGRGSSSCRSSIRSRPGPPVAISPGVSYVLLRWLI